MGQSPEAQLRYPPAYEPNEPEATPPSTSRKRAAYYISLPTPLESEEDNEDDRVILRVVLYALFLLFINACATHGTFYLFNPKMPSFHINSLIVSDFNISSLGVISNWNINMRVENQNDMLQVLFGQVGIYLYYEDIQILSTTNLTHFMLTRNEQILVVAHLQRNQAQEEEHFVANQVLDQMAMDRERGTMNFYIKLKLLLAFRIGDTLIADMVINAYCEDLKIKFMGDQGDGMLTSVGGSFCSYLPRRR